MPRDSRQKTIASIKRGRTKRLATLITKVYFLYRRGREEQMYNLICEEFMSLGGVYVKFLQGVLLRSQVMRKWHNPEKLRIFENLDHEPIDIAKLLQYELPKDKLSQIALVQPEPFAAGSFGQVYYGQLRNGQPIIIKVLRPMIRELLKHDLRLLARFSKMFFNKLYKNMSMDLQGAFRDFSEATLNETNYKREAEFANELYNHYKGHPTVHIPQTYLELSTDDIIVQDYVDGISLAHIIKLHEQGVDPVQYVQDTLGSDLVMLLQTFGYESLVGIFEMPRIQGDPHPGNIRIMSNNKIGLIDFGISATPPADKSGLFGVLDTYDKIFKGSQTAVDMFEQGLRFFVGDLYRSLRRLGEYLGSGAGRNYVSDVSEVAGKIFNDATGSDVIQLDLKQDSSVLMVINKLVNKGNRFGLIMKLEATDILRAIQTYTSLLSSLGLYQQVMPPTVSRAVEYLRAHHSESVTDSREAVNMSSALETIASWLERVAVRDPMLFRQLSSKMNMRPETELQLETESERID
jgi:ubiquinone biosynthesis protein